MPQRKRLEDDLRSVWAEWSTPHDYGLWHEHKEPTTVEKVEETLLLAPPQPPPAPEPIDTTSSAAEGGAGSAEAPPATKLKLPSSPSKKRGTGVISPEKKASVLEKLSPEARETAKGALRSLPKKLILQGLRKYKENPNKVVTDVPQVPDSKIHQLVKDGLSLSKSHLKHVTKAFPQGYDIYVAKDKEGKIQYYFYKDRAGSIRRITGKALETAEAHYGKAK
jgi:hypothetical protein